MREGAARKQYASGLAGECASGKRGARGPVRQFSAGPSPSSASDFMARYATYITVTVGGFECSGYRKRPFGVNPIRVACRPGSNSPRWTVVDRGPIPIC